MAIDQSRGWTDSASQHLQHLLLEVVDSATSNGARPALSTYAETLNESPEAVIAAGRSLRYRGLLAGDSRLAGDAAMAVELTERGRALLRERRARRENARSSRALACRDAFLNWCYASTISKGYISDIEEFSKDVRSYFEGAPFTPAEIAWASAHLRDIGMITGPEVEGVGIARPNITPRGRTVVENYDSSITTYNARPV